jgi:DNA repair exonuclease SbcCD ATPase subunit
MTVNANLLRQLSQDLIDAKDQLRTKKDLERALARARQTLQEQRRKLWELETQLAKESADVETLEILSLRGLFLSILGNKEEQLEKDRQELLRVKLQHDECQEAIDKLKQEVEDLKHHIESLGDVEARHQSLLQRKEEALLQTDREDARRLLELSEAEADVRSDLRELREAISAGNSVLNSLDSVVSALRTAGNWGTVDLLGGGILTTAVKHGRVDEARRWAHQAQRRLRRFRRELTDLEPDARVSIELGGFETFADYFFDGLIADWVVQTRIRSSLDRAIEMRRRVQTIVNDLERELQQAQGRLERIKAERKELVEQA